MRKAMIFRRLAALAVGAVAVALVLAAGAGATRVTAGNLIFDFDFGFKPHALSRRTATPIRVSGHEAVSTRDGSVPAPATHLSFEFNRHGSLDTEGLATCPPQRLQAPTVAQAERLCPRALVGHGYATAIVAFPESNPFSASTKTLFFNGPRLHGDPTLVVHGHLAVPVPTTYVDSFVIERVHHGELGYRVDGDLARIAGGAGSLTYFRFHLGDHWTEGGRRHSYLAASCPSTATQLLGRGTTSYADGTVLRGAFFGHCRIRAEH
jgi:hypothetical protein